MGERAWRWMDGATGAMESVTNYSASSIDERLECDAHGFDYYVYFESGQPFKA